MISKKYEEDILLEHININDLVEYDNNPKSHPETQIDLLMNEILIDGFKIPIIIDENNVIIDGHGRVEALYQLINNKKINNDNYIVPCIRLNNLDDTQKRRIRIVVDKLREGAKWDYDKLKTEIDEIIKNSNIDINIEELGFNQNEIDLIMNNIKIEDEFEFSEATLEKEYNEPNENRIQCPKCKHIDNKAMFKKIE